MHESSGLKAKRVCQHNPRNEFRKAFSLIFIPYVQSFFVAFRFLKCLWHGNGKITLSSRYYHKQIEYCIMIDECIFLFFLFSIYHFLSSVWFKVQTARKRGLKPVFFTAIDYLIFSMSTFDAIRALIND